jgi:hypothetical protein
MIGGPDPLDGISFYPRADYWHISADHSAQGSNPVWSTASSDLRS